MTFEQAFWFLFGMAGAYALGFVFSALGDWVEHRKHVRGGR